MSIVSNDPNQLQQENPLLEAALEYARLGYPVFPCRVGQKLPRTEHGRNDATTDPEVIQQWWAANPRANVGLVTDGLLVVDVDGKDNPWPTDPELAAELISAPTSITPRGGRHHVFRQPQGKGWRSTAGRLASRVDTRADGGYIVVSPSSLEDGGEYQWVEDLELNCPRHQLPEPPPWLVAMLDQLAAGRGPGKFPSSEVMLDSSNSISNLNQDAPGEILEGSRNATLTSLGGTMRRRGMGGGAIYSALAVTNREDCRPPLPDSEVRAIAKSVTNYAPNAVPLSILKGQHKKILEWEIETESFAEIKERPYCWLWNGRIPFGMLSVIEGPPKQGKSTVMFDIMARLTTGCSMPCSEEPILEAAPCLLIAPEDPTDQVVKPRLMANGADLRLVQHLKGFTAQDGEKVKKRRFTLADEDLTELERLILTHGYKLVYVDAVMGLIPSKVDSNSDQLVRSQVLDPLAALADSTGASIVIGRHWAKGAAGRQAFERGLGSIAFTGVARSVLQVARHPEDKDLKLLAVGAGNIGKEPPILGYRIQSATVGGVGGLELPTSRIDWQGVVEIDLEELGRVQPTGGHSGREECGEWLLARISELGGDAPSDQIEREAANRGFSIDMLKRAKLAMKEKIVSKRVGNVWRVRLRDTDAAMVTNEIFN